MGHDLLVQFLSFAQPDFIVQCKSFVSKHHFPLSEIDLSTLNNTRYFSFLDYLCFYEQFDRVYSCITPIVDQQKKFDYRSAITRSYFSPIDSIESQLPYCIPWNKYVRSILVVIMWVISYQPELMGSFQLKLPLCNSLI